MTYFWIEGWGSNSHRTPICQVSIEAEPVSLLQNYPPDLGCQPQYIQLILNHMEPHYSRGLGRTWSPSVYTTITVTFLSEGCQMSKSLIYGCQLNGVGDICKVKQCSMFISNSRLHRYTVLIFYEQRFRD